MQIVIDIPEGIYKILCKNPSTDIVRQAVIDGTPLPKGHSSLIDRQETLDAIIKRLGISGEKYLLESERAIYQQIMAMPPIIEADKTESEEEQEEY